MKGYKATYSGKCRGLNYRPGKTYIFHGELSMCIQGLHFCPDIRDTVRWYPYREDFKIFKTEAEGKTIEGDNKAVTDRLRIIEEVPLDTELLKELGLYFDNKGRLKYEIKDMSPLFNTASPSENKYKLEYFYDDRDRLVRCTEESSGGHSIVWEYDNRGNLISERKGNCHITFSYDKNNNCIEENCNNTSRRKRREYDDRGNCIGECYYTVSPYVYITEYRYDKNNNCIEFIDRDPCNEESIVWDYDEDNNCISQGRNGVEEWSIEIIDS